MTKGRLEAFSDGVIAILITIMVLELKVPHGATWDVLEPMLPVFLAYVLSFLYVAIYWNNHHHLLHAAERISGSVMWANMGLLFLLSLVPFATGWMGENHNAPVPTALYGGVLLGAALAYSLLVRRLLAIHPKDSRLAKAIGSDLKGWISVALYVAAIACSFVHVLIADALYVAVALIWLVPDRRIERVEHDERAHANHAR
jgi:uncharacterized membrane protein